MPSPPRVEPDLAMTRACRLLEAIRAAVPPEGVSTQMLDAAIGRGRRYLNPYTPAEYRAAIAALRECGALNYSRGIFTRGQMF